MNRVLFRHRVGACQLLKPGIGDDRRRRSAGEGQLLAFGDMRMQLAKIVIDQGKHLAHPILELQGNQYPRDLGGNVFALLLKTAAGVDDGLGVMPEVLDHLGHQVL